jgi:hypothetical protein
LDGGVLRERMQALLVEADSVRSTLEASLPAIQRQAYEAGPRLRQLCRQ